MTWRLTSKVLVYPHKSKICLTLGFVQKHNKSFVINLFTPRLLKCIQLQAGSARCANIKY